MKSGVAFWRALKPIKDIHPCWAHLNGQALSESDLPRPISTEYKSIFDLPTSRTGQEQNEAIAKADAVPRTTRVMPDASADSMTDAAKTVELLAAAMRGSEFATA
jgi:hypothetical protein